MYEALHVGVFIVALLIIAKTGKALNVQQWDWLINCGISMN